MVDLAKDNLWFNYLAGSVAMNMTWIGFENEIVRVLEAFFYFFESFHFHTDEELNHAISEYAYGWYNQIRPHSYNGYRTPYEVRFGLESFRW